MQSDYNELRFGFKIIRENNVAKLWTADKEFRDRWVDNFKAHCILTKFDEHYLVKATICKGKFCTVRQPHDFLVLIENRETFRFCK